MIHDTGGTICLLVIHLLLFADHNSIGFSELDPCLPNNYHILQIDGARNSNCSKISSKCDHYLDSKWYITPGAIITTSCPQLLRCGFTYPVWMKGSLPMEAEGIVNRTGCMVTGTTPEDCCLDNYTSIIRIKNCTTFFVYFLDRRPGCDEGYCFDSNLPCPTTTTSTTTTPSAQTTSQNYTSDKESVSNLSTDVIVAIAIGIALALAIVTVGVFGIIYMKYMSRKVQSQKHLSTMITLETGTKNVFQ